VFTQSRIHIVESHVAGQGPVIIRLIVEPKSAEVLHIGNEVQYIVAQHFENYQTPIEERRYVVFNDVL